MATTTLTIGNELLSTTMHVLMEDWRDGAYEKTMFIEYHEKKYGKGQPTQDGGTRIVVPVAFGEHSTTTRIQTGYERIDLTVSDIFVPGVYDWGHCVRPVVISIEEEYNNRGEAAIIDMAAARTKQAANAMMREFDRQMLKGSEGGWDDWNTLNGIDVATGFLEDDAIGSQGNLVGGISKATYSGKPGWQNQVFDGADSFNSNGLAGLYDVDTEIAAVSDTKYDCIIASRSGFKNLKRAAQANERYVTQDKIDAGKPVELWNGVPVSASRNMPNAGTGTTANPVSFYFLDQDDIHCVFSPDAFFDLSDFETVSGEFDVRSAKLRTRGQLIAQLLGSSGLLHSCEIF